MEQLVALVDENIITRFKVKDSYLNLEEHVIFARGNIFSAIETSLALIAPVAECFVFDCVSLSRAHGCLARMWYDCLLWVFAGVVVLGFAVSQRGNAMERYRGVVFQYGGRRPFQDTGRTGTGSNFYSRYGHGRVVTSLEGSFAGGQSGAKERQRGLSMGMAALEPDERCDRSDLGDGYLDPTVVSYLLHKLTLSQSKATVPPAAC
ncbi:hypothetical protein T440DRAFT_484105 [Plenodomus tracheiphilus IPT5]|uniref:Uncharacterized protein n=1 Tax=Plenodomus tracheiphilus IPT5 TaxID=1408161 RepID=A0A6A7ANA6_9PLEO|nr:hypothetical protein T440DRAFT_484105 [Plenodomus tracheiphilus IPT5]